MPTFVFEGTELHAEDGETVLGALLRSDKDVAHGCRAGACQSCLLRTTEPPASAQVGLDDHLVESGAFLSCLAKADSIGPVERMGSLAVPRTVAEVRGVRRLAADVLMLELEAAGWQARPGRFVRLVHATGVVRPYSLAAAAWEDPARIQLHIRLLPDGALSSLVQRAEIGDRYEIEGPLGKCCYRSSTQNEPILLIGSGTGLAPLYGIATDALHQGHAGPIHLFHGAATGARLYFRDELRALQARHPNFHYHPCVDAEPVEGDELGSPLALALAAHPGLEGYKVYVCGHPDLVKTSQRKCFLAGANLKDIAADAFAPSAS